MESLDRILCINKILGEKSNEMWLQKDFRTIMWPWFRPWTTDAWWLNLCFFAAQIEIPIPNKYLGFGIKSLCFCRNNQRKIPQMPQNLSAQFVCPSPKVLNIFEYRILGVRSPWFCQYWKPMCLLEMRMRTESS